MCPRAPAFEISRLRPVDRGTLFEVADTDAAVARAIAAGGGASAPSDFVYGRIAEITDPFGARFTVGARPPGQRG